VTTSYSIDWSEHADWLAGAAKDDADWYAALAGSLVRPGDRLAVDVGCGGGGMARALAAVLPTGGRAVGVDAASDVLDRARGATPVGLPVRYVTADLAGDLAAVRDVLGGPADVVWASAAVHHAGDQQAAVGGLAALLAPGGRLVLSEGGLRPRFMPWDVGVGAPGLEVRLEAAHDAWFAQMRAELPGSVPMPYGWTEALRRAGLTGVTTRSTLLEHPVPLPDPALALDPLTWRVGRLRAAGLLPAADEAAWDRLLDPDDPAYLGRRTDLYRLEARSVHIGHRQR
jgi:SAM-dependent methyltransferase